MEPKLCECGCGQPTPIIRANCKARGYVKGHFHRYIYGHQNRGRKLTADQRKKRSANMVGHPVAEETRRKISEQHKAAGIRPPEEFAFRTGISRPKRESSPNWKGGISYVSGYRCVYMPDHPRSHPNGYVYEHILIAESSLARPLDDQEVVHHRDGDKLNNSPENIEILSSQSEHIQLHRSQGDL